MTATGSTTAASWPALRRKALHAVLLLLSRPLPTALSEKEAMLTRRESRLVVAWLKPLEAVVRALIVVAALAFPHAAWRRLGDRPRRADDDRERGAGGPSSPLGFRVFGGRPGESSGSRGGAPSALVPVAAYVARLDALCRIVEDPRPWIRRAARHMRLDASALSGGEDVDAAEAEKAPAPPRSLREITESALFVEARALRAQTSVFDTS
jgi:hypothetical protein